MEKQENSKYEIWQPLLLALIMALGLLLGSKLDDQLPTVTKVSSGSPDNAWSELKSVIGFIESRYGDSLEVDSLAEAAIELVVSNLDPHSYYLSGLDYKGFKERMQGSYVGIGIEYDIIDDTVVVTKVIPDGPAANANLQPGDQILKIGEFDIADPNQSYHDKYEAWRNAGDTLFLEVRKADGSVHKKLEILQAPVRLESVPIAFMLSDSIGYVLIERFASDSYSEFMAKLEMLNGQGMKDLIIDVRNNPGGSLDQVIKMLNQLVIERDQLLLFTEGLNSKKVEYKSTGKRFFQIEDIVVIIDENSVSASEVLAGVLQDLGRATIVGRRSFGKGLVQEMYDLSPNSALNLTVAKYYLPSGRFIQRPFDDRDAYEEELNQRIASGELFDESLISIDSASMVRATDGKMRPSGEGIVPDVFVPADSSRYSVDWRNMEKSIKKDAFKFLRSNPDLIKELLQDESKKASLSDSIFSRPLFRAPSEDIASGSRQRIVQEYTNFLKRVEMSDSTYLKDQSASDPAIQIGLKVLEN